MLGPLFNMPYPIVFMTWLTLSLHMQMISPLFPSFGHNTFIIFIPSSFDVTSTIFTSIPLSVSFVFMPTNYWASLFPNTTSLLTLSKFNPFSNFLLLPRFANYKGSKENPTFFVSLFLTMPPLHMGFLDSFDLTFHSFGMTKLNSILIP